RSGLGDLQDEVGRLARSFDEMADRIQAARRAEKELLANVSHELRTPLARIKVALELIDAPGEGVRRRLSAIGEEVDELDQLVADILTASRPASASDSRSRGGWRKHTVERRGRRTRRAEARGSSCDSLSRQVRSESYGRGCGPGGLTVAGGAASS